MTVSTSWAEVIVSPFLAGVGVSTVTLSLSLLAGLGACSTASSGLWPSFLHPRAGLLLDLASTSGPLAPGAALLPRDFRSAAGS